jgi:DNA-binding NarL/FixJ family response regulator
MTTTADDPGAAQQLDFSDQDSGPGIPREWELDSAESRVVIGVVTGQQPSEIAAELRLPVHAVRTQLQRAMAKAGVHTQAALVVSVYAANQPWVNA